MIQLLESAEPGNFEISTPQPLPQSGLSVDRATRKDCRPPTIDVRSRDRVDDYKIDRRTRHHVFLSACIAACLTGFATLAFAYFLLNVN